MAPPGRKSSGKQKARVEDSDSDGDEGRVPKYDDIQPEYLNQPIDSRQGDSKIRTLSGELSLVVKELKSTAETIMLVAADLASSLSQPEVFENLDYDNLPEDPVSGQSVSARRGVLTRFTCRMRSRSWTRSFAQ